MVVKRIRELGIRWTGIFGAIGGSGKRLLSAVVCHVVRCRVTRSRSYRSHYAGVERRDEGGMASRDQGQQGPRRLLQMSSYLEQLAQEDHHLVWIRRRGVGDCILELVECVVDGRPGPEGWADLVDSGTWVSGGRDKELVKKMPCWVLRSQRGFKTGEDVEERWSGHGDVSEVLT